MSFLAQKPANDPTAWQVTPLTNFRVYSVEQLIYEDVDVYAECGLVLTDVAQRELVVAAGVSPGSVTVASPTSGDLFDPEPAIDKLRRRSL
ncbi:hypothetical protein [Variovorax sp. KK3]|uniref:hypothetical protein n=1 Tax=Variovorax sp. KK3 TaxID=1855728 RepID=UPI00117FD470|nr:hypothetical protein [Variovorax sp. KK3]